MTDLEGALPMVGAIANTIKRTMPVTLFMSGGQLVRQGASGLVPVTPDWLGIGHGSGRRGVHREMENQAYSAPFRLGDFCRRSLM